MCFLEREAARIRAALNQTPDGAEFDRLYAAQQALEWALDPTSCASPLDMIEVRPRIKPISRISTKEDYPFSSRPA
jgi:hypothetical protein